MTHTRNKVVKRAIREFRLLDHLVSRLTTADWRKAVRLPEAKEPWTVKDALAHITYWKQAWFVKHAANPCRLNRASSPQNSITGCIYAITIVQLMRCWNGTGGCRKIC